MYCTEQANVDDLIRSKALSTFAKICETHNPFSFNFEKMVCASWSCRFLIHILCFFPLMLSSKLSISWFIPVERKRIIFVLSLKSGGYFSGLMCCQIKTISLVKTLVLSSTYMTGGTPGYPEYLGYLPGTFPVPRGYLPGT